MLGVIVLQDLQQERCSLANHVALQEHVSHGVEVDGGTWLLGHSLGQVHCALRVVHAQPLQQVQVVRPEALRSTAHQSLISGSSASDRYSRHVVQ